MKRFAKPAMFGLFILFLLWGIFYRYVFRRIGMIPKAGKAGDRRSPLQRLRNTANAPQNGR